VYKKIVVGTDLSDTARIATDRAHLLAQKLGADLTLVHAGRDSDELAKLASELGARSVAHAGNPAEVLLGEVENQDADLLVVGSVGMTGARRFLLGSVPNKISHHATTDVLIVKTDPPPRSIESYSTILVGTDGSPTATRAVKMAAGLAAAVGAKPVIVCVYTPPTEQELKRMKSDPSDPVAQWSAGRDERGVPDEFRWRIAGAAQAEDVLERSLQHASAGGVEPEVRAVEGHPAETLISLAEDEGFDLIAVGSVGMSGPKRFMLGNVPHRISHHAPTDILILHTS
jgi:nucleotide-binding universal stress UspA family protein